MILKGNSKGTRFMLRPWKVGDEKDLANSANNVKIWRNMVDSFPNPYTVKEAKKWIKIANEKGNVNFAIIIDGKTVGGIGFKVQAGNHKSTAEFGYWLAEEHWGKGIATAATKLVLRHASKNPDIIRMQAHVFPWNPASRRVLEKCGFKLEGVLRKNSIKAGVAVDELIFSKIRKKY